jgi:hypothetical protein
VHTLAPGETAWIVLVPCTAILVAAIVVLGPVLGHALLAPGPDTFWPAFPTRPEPVEHGRYVVALLGPLLLAGSVLACAHRDLRLSARSVRQLALTGQLAIAAVLVACLAAENDIVLHAYVSPYTPDRIFDWQTLSLAAVLALLLAFVPRRRRFAARLGRLLRESRPKRAAGLAIAGALTAVWLFTGIDSDLTVGRSLDSNWIAWPLDETFAVLDGRTPLLDFHALYGQLSPYPPALVMSVLGATLATWTVTMASISWLALIGVYATFRRILRSSLLALALYVPLLAVGNFISAGTSAHRLSPASIFSLWPIRYAGPYLVAWAVARHLDGERPRRAWPLFLAAGLALLNNPEFGSGAVAGTLLALACARAPPSRAGIARLLRDAASGMLAALALVSLLTLSRSGHLPRLGLLLEYPRLFGAGGWRLAPMRPFGFHVAAYLTFGAAIVIAVVRGLRRHHEAVLTGMLAWSGAFGLIAGSYYVGESEAGSMLSLFSAWFLALALLAIVVVRGLAASGRRPSLPGLAVLFGFGLAVCAIPQIPSPWSEVARLSHASAAPILEQPAATRFVAAATHRGERVAIFMPLGHRIAYDAGIVNVSPYATIQSMPTWQMLQRTLDGFRAQHVRNVFVGDDSTTAEQMLLLTRNGFRVSRHGSGYRELTDSRPAH